MEFIYFSSNISSTENHVNISICKAWTAIDRLITIWESDLSDKIDENFSKLWPVSLLLDCCTTLISTKFQEKELDGNYIKMLHAVLSKSRNSILPNSCCMATNLSSHKLWKLNEQDILDKQGWNQKWCSAMN